MITTIATIDLKKLHEIYQDVRVEYPNYSCRFQYFLAGCRLIDSDFDLDIALKLRPHGGLIGIDDSKLDKYLNQIRFYDCMQFCMTPQVLCMSCVEKDRDMFMLCLVQSATSFADM